MHARAQPQLASPFSGFPNAFILNVGQVKNQREKPNEDVQFIYQSGAFSLCLTRTGYSMQLIHESRQISSHSEAGGRPGSEGLEEALPGIQTIERVDVRFSNCNPSFTMEANLPETGPVNLYLSNVHECTKAYRRITYHEIYPHIDLVFEAGMESQSFTPRFEFILRPGADPRVIRLDHSGAASISLNGGSEVKLTTAMGWLTYSGLHTFIEATGKPVHSSFRLQGEVIGFSLPSPVTETTIIDPNILWGTYFGGEKDESNSFDITRDTHDNLLITGVTKSVHTISSEGSYQESYAGGSGDIYLAKFNTHGERLWSTYFGGNHYEISYAVTTDLWNNIYVVGNSSSEELSTPGAYQEDQAGGSDNLIAKFDSAGLLVWCTFLGGQAVEQVRSVAADVMGHIYICGYTESNNGIAYKAAIDSIYNGEGDAFVSKFTSDGQLLWSTYVGGTGQDRAHSLVADSQHVYVLGTTESDTGMATPGAFKEFRSGHEDVWLALLDTGGNRLWSTYYGGAEEDHGRCVRIDKLQYAYISGFTGSSEGIATAGSHQSGWYEAYSQDDIPLVDGYVAKFSAEGQLIWGTYYGGEGNDQIVSIDLDRQANIYCAGSTSSFDSIADNNPMMRFHGFTGEGLLAKLDSSGHRIWGSFFGGFGSDDLWSLVADTNDFIYFIGRTDSIVEMPPGAFQPASSGKADAIIFKVYGGQYCYDAFEPNEDTAQAALIAYTTDSLSYGITAAISGDLDEDWYSFTMQPGYSYFKITLTDLTEDYNLRLYRMNGQLLMQSRNPGQRSEFLTGRLYPNTYRLQVNHPNVEFDTINCYRLILYAGTKPFDDSGSRMEFSEDQPSLTLNPNPASDWLNITFYTPDSYDGVCELYSVAMKKVAEKKFSGMAGLNSLAVPVQHLSSGLYVLVLHTARGILYEKVVIQNK